MVEPKYVYALCRNYDPKPVMFNDEREIKLGIEENPIIVELFNLFRTNKNEYVARLQVIGRGNGTIVGMITDHFEQRPVKVTVPLDDLVEEQYIAHPTK